MNISYNWLKSHIDFNFSVEELDNVLTMLGIEVESYEKQSEKYKNFFIAEVLEKISHPNADKLSICRLSTNGVTPDLQVVCGAPNVNTGQKVIVGIVGAVVPSNGVRLDKRLIRDFYSEGMICSQTELGLGDDATGIWVLPASTTTGLALTDYLNMNDIILEISLTPNKSDCSSHFGIAREIAAYMRKKISSNSYTDNQKRILQKTTKENIEDTIQINIKDNSLCPRYSARVIKNIKNTDSPEWLKNTLLNIGVRPINLVVDVTNWVLMDCGHPLHAFDLDKISNKTICVKNGFDNYKFTTLDGKQRTLSKEMLMICDVDIPIAVAGVMGGENSEITHDTTNIIIESAYFNPISIRKTAKKLGLSTDASYRFERGADIDIILYALDKAATMIVELAGGYIANNYIDIYENKYEPLKIEFSFSKARSIIGVDDISETEILEIFETLGFSILQLAKDKAYLEIPHRRNDITSEIDLIEEVARLINYDNIPADYSANINLMGNNLPQTLQPLALRNKLRNYLAHIGYNEILTYNIIEPSAANLFTNDPIVITNPLGEEMSRMRPSMLTQLLKTVAFNINQGSTSLQLFETGKIFLPENNITNSFIEGIDERENLVIAIAGSATPRQWTTSERKFDFYDIKGTVEEIFRYLKISNIKFKAMKQNEIFDVNSANIMIEKRIVGTLGSISNIILKKYNLELPVFVATIDLTELNEIDFTPQKFVQISQYPSISRDLAFIVDEKYSANEIKKSIKEKSGRLLKSIDIFDVYKGKNIAENKYSIGFNLTFSSNEKTLTDTEIESDITNIIQSVEKKFSAELRNK